MSVETMRRRAWVVLLLLGTAPAVWGVCVLLSSGAGAQGIPTSDALTYSGQLGDTAGKPLSGSHKVAVALIKASGGAALCSSVAKTVDLSKTGGRFSVTLPATCLTVVQANPDLWVRVTVDGKDKLEQRVSAAPYAVVGARVDPLCPPGYTQAKGAKGVLCARGADEVVKVGDFWIDRYEVSVVDSDLYNGGRCDGTKGIQYGTKKDDYDQAKFIDSGSWAGKLFACSIKGRTPSQYMTWFQAAQACALAGKHLCTTEEWQAAAAGTYDPGVYDGATGGACHTDDTKTPKAPKVRNTGLAGTTSKACVSNWGAEDMTGNVSERVSWWGQEGIYSYYCTSSAWLPGVGYGDGKDRTYNVCGKAWKGSGSYSGGLLATSTRGGGVGWKTNAGVFTLHRSYGPQASPGTVGARCCR